MTQMIVASLTKNLRDVGRFALTDALHGPSTLQRYKLLRERDCFASQMPREAQAARAPASPHG
jgi:hypothetical protein